MFDLFSSKPKYPPLQFRPRANQFLEYVFDEKNGVMHRLANGHLHFTAFLEGSGQELITYGAIVLGKLLRGENVDDLLPSLADYYSDEYGIYQNGVGDKRSEYWYLMHVNALAWCITRLALMDDPVSVQRLKSSMNRLMELAHQIDYDFNDQGYDFENSRSFTNQDAYRQPDTIGAYSYLMQFGYETFGEAEYQAEASLAMQKYLSFADNPWYEIPSGAMACLAVARMNAQGHGFSLNKAVSFALDSHQGSLHVGHWGGLEINGLMRGWKGHSREEASSMAYSLETLVLLPYLLPVARYDHQIAKQIGRYALHTAANMRLFYSEFFSLEAQGRPDLTPVVPYEAVHRERKGHSPYATGDFHGQKSVYGGALTLWWGEIVRSTSDPYVLELDLTKTDFLGMSDKTAPVGGNSVCMYYNPHRYDIDVTISLGDVPVDLYDARTQSLLQANISNSAILHLDADSATIVNIVKR
ncbi:hypothetical protein [Alicyclobacillus dauci]|uniref:Uncharacterized protein n=1 Tax=Alicyclobacillus dauci TaxID=1475485 RepID=A0ABY6Z5J8_9BACL|nr:hypothetical protein [Alicyclobacillus dauci]WAH38168.1 hypothetical protein NZD86_06695 [Alicyclobacillus dauci]